MPLFHDIREPRHFTLYSGSKRAGADHVANGESVNCGIAERALGNRFSPTERTARNSIYAPFGRVQQPVVQSEAQFVADASLCRPKSLFLVH